MSAVSPVTQVENPFDVFFKDSVYLELKNHLYSYLRRREAVRSFLNQSPREGLILEVGSGISPISERRGNVVFSDVSPGAIRYLKDQNSIFHGLAMDASQLAMKDEAISTLICSEVIEHIADDDLALREMARVLKKGGELLLTVPIHSYLHTVDDEFVHHKRRYGVRPLLRRLRELGFTDFRLAKVAALLEKGAAILAVTLFRLLRRNPEGEGRKGGGVPRLLLFLYKGVNRLYARFVEWETKWMPLRLTSVLLISCKKR